MSGCRLLLVFVLVTICCYSTTIYAGPARSFALVAARAAKIPRSIRAPFNNQGMMTARGFGKRSQQQIFHSKDGIDLPWGYGGKRETKFFDDFGNNGENGNNNNNNNGDAIEQIFNEQPVDSFPIDWLANEMANNPLLARTILHRFVDANKDGLLTANELLSPSSSSSSSLSQPSSISSLSSSGSSIDNTDLF